MRLHALQYLRAIAALAVVYSHAAIQVEDYGQYLLNAGSFGVDIFFVISGFIMIFISKPGDTPGAFIVNRIRRVVPLYWFFTFLMAAILLAMPSVFKATVFEWGAFINSLLFLPDWSIAQPSMVWPIVAPGWSLNFEMYFYALFAISLFFPERLRIVFITACITTVFLIANHFHDGTSAAAQLYAKSMVFEFILGMLLAVAWKRGFKLSPAMATCLLIVGTSLLFLKLPVARIFEYGVPSLLIVMACLYIKLPRVKWAELLGDASYSLYISHIFTLGVLRIVLVPLLGEGQLAAILFVCISLVVSTIASVVIHQVIDNWLLRHERIKFCTKPRPEPSKV